MRLILSVLVVSFLLIEGFAQAEPLYPLINANTLEGEIHEHKWSEHFWINIFHGNQYESIQFHDPDTNEVMHTLRIKYDDENKPASISIDGRLEFSLVKYHLRIKQRSRELSEEIEADSGYITTDQEYDAAVIFDHIVQEETQNMINDYHEFLSKSLSYFHAQNYFRGDASLIVNIQNLQKMRRAAKLSNYASILLIPVFFATPFPEPYSIVGSYSIGIEARRRQRIAAEIERRLDGYEYRTPAPLLSLRIWRTLEKKPWILKTLQWGQDQLLRQVNFMLKLPKNAKKLSHQLKTACETRLLDPVKATVTAISPK